MILDILAWIIVISFGLILVGLFLTMIYLEVKDITRQDIIAGLETLSILAAVLLVIWAFIHASNTVFK